MEKKQPITVRVNREQLRKPVDHAEVIHEATVKEIPKGPNVVSSPKSSRSGKQLPPILKLLLFAGIPAAAIGLLFGFTMLHLFSGMGTSAPSNQDIPLTTANSSDSDQNKHHKNDNAKKVNNGTYALPGINAFVIQGGIFSEMGNAEKAKKEFEAAGFPASIVEQDGQYFLQAGIVPSDQAAKSMAEKMKKSKLDVYAKAWSIDSKEVQLDKKEHEWIILVQKNMQSALKTMDKDGNFDSSGWADVANKQPGHSSKLKAIQEDVSAMSRLGKEAALADKQALLLQIFQDYESIADD